MPIVVVPVKISPPHPCVEMKVICTARCATILDASAANTLEYTIELLVTDMETVVMALEMLGLVEVERQCFVDIDWGKVADFCLPGYT